MPETKNNEDRENTSPVIGILGQVNKNFNSPNWKKIQELTCVSSNGIKTKKPISAT